MLRKLRYHLLSTTDLVQIYISFVRPILEYAAPVWSNAITREQCNSIERIQKRACRIALGPDYSRYSDALQNCKLKTLEYRRNQLCVMFANSLQHSKLLRLLPEKKSSAYCTQKSQTIHRSQMQNLEIEI